MIMSKSQTQRKSERQFLPSERQNESGVAPKSSCSGEPQVIMRGCCWRCDLGVAYSNLQSSNDVKRGWWSIQLMWFVVNCTYCKYWCNDNAYCLYRATESLHCQLSEVIGVLGVKPLVTKTISFRRFFWVQYKQVCSSSVYSTAWQF